VSTIEQVETKSRLRRMMARALIVDLGLPQITTIHSERRCGRAGVSAIKKMGERSKGMT
jgi:hypothetical protein